MPLPPCLHHCPPVCTAAPLSLPSPPHLHGRGTHEGTPPPAPSHLAVPPCTRGKGDGTRPPGALHIGPHPFPLVRTTPYVWKGHMMLATPPSFPICTEGAHMMAHHPASPPRSLLPPFPLHATQMPPFPLATPPHLHGERKCTPPPAPLVQKGCMQAHHTTCVGKGHAIPDPTLPHSHGRGCTQAHRSVRASRGSRGQAVSGSRTGTVSVHPCSPHPHPIFTRCSTT
ncbi:hypothetical protein EDB92DRAFT_1820627 [Lactarius akahatsu]|uniref:Uncharacterized protein n=1 Tax=Lactarius akahatsu TaxID=416441 RepID=A0AAD4LA61_9AGAM|nr:hypothetical protein EDB92DRAFT_1820627 [Lactarius akahatsu]